jgi:hypothetical protein
MLVLNGNPKLMSYVVEKIHPYSPTPIHNNILNYDKFTELEAELERSWSGSWRRVAPNKKYYRAIC